jgi:hypothetical protein
MSYFLVKKLKGITNKMGFRTRLAPPSDALPAISDAVANTAVARDVLVSRADTPPVKTDSFPSIRGAVLRNELGAGAASPSFASPVPLTASQLVAESRDVLRTAMDGPKLDIHNGTELKLTVKRLTKYQDAVIAYYKSRNMTSIVEFERMPILWANRRERYIGILKELAVFHLERGEKVEDVPINWMNPMHTPLLFLGPTALLKGKNPRLDTLKALIRRFREMQNMVKEATYDPEMSEEQNNILANSIFEKPMDTIAEYAGNMYHFLLFTHKEGGILASGMCTARHDSLMAWLGHLEGLLKKSIKDFKEEMELMELRRRVASLEARLMAQ